MSSVICSISMSLDGFIAGPNDEIDPLHDWLYGLATWRAPHGMEGGTHDADAEILEEVIGRVGATIIGRRMYDLTDGWGDVPPFHHPVFVLTHRGGEPVAKEGDTTFIFVTDGIESAVEQARAAAGEKDVALGGGASVVQQALAANLVDELQIHLIPVLLGDGIRLFGADAWAPRSLERDRIVESPSVTHMRYRLTR